MRKLFAVIMALAMILGMVGCSATPASTDSTTALPKRAYWPTQGWQTSTPEAQGMDAATLNGITKYVTDSGATIDSVVVVRHGYIVYENYFGYFDATTPHRINSCTKSFMGALVGIALKQGAIKSLDTKMIDYFKDRSIQNLDDRKKSITLLDLMEMKGGFDWSEWTYPYTDPRNPWIQALNSPDTIQFVLDTPMANDPGTVWAYNGGYSQIFSAIVTDKTGMSTLDFAQQNLFKPLGFSYVSWSTDHQGIYDAGGGLMLFPRDMAKFGWLYLNKGVWDGKQIIPADYVAEATSTQTSLSAVSGYGYESWWTLPLKGYYYAAGLNGQRIYVIDKQDMVVVTTATMPEGNAQENTLQSIADMAISACK